MSEDMQASQLLRREINRTDVSRPANSWKPLVDEPLCDRIIEAALCAGERLHDPIRVNEIAQLSLEQTTIPSQWSTFSLASGFAGIALMQGYVTSCFPGQGWDLRAQQSLRIAAEGTQQTALMQPDLFGGTAGIGMVLHTLRNGGKRYQKTLIKLHRNLCEQVLEQPWLPADGEQGMADHNYDAISGASGILAYLLTVELEDEQTLNTIEFLLAYLTWLAEPGQTPGQERWYVPPESLIPQTRQGFPEGYFNCGLAHGIPGPLAALALAWKSGYRYPNLRESIHYLSSWLMQHQIREPWGMGWPDAVPLHASRAAKDWRSLHKTRTAWCYGNPGVARSLWLAGQALEDDNLCQEAVKAIETALRRPVPLRQINSPTLCHGVAGLLQICLRFAHESESTIVREHIPLLATQILDAFNPDFPLGFRDLERENIPIDQPAWLTGAPGVVMTLLATATSVTPKWDRIMLIS